MRAYLAETILDPRGSVVVGASVRVEDGSGSLVADPLYSADGSSLSNPLTTDASGGITFYLDRPQRVNLRASKDGVSSAPLSRDAITPFDEWLDVRAYGAKGDGTTDDSAAIQAAISAGSVIYLPSGTYCCLSGLTLGEAQTLIGHQAIVDYQGAGAALTISADRATFRRVRVQGLHFITSAGTPTTGISVYQTEGVAISDCSVKGIPLGLNVDASYAVRIDRFDYDGMGRAGSVGVAFVNTANANYLTASTILWAAKGIRIIGSSSVGVRDVLIEGTVANSVGVEIQATATEYCEGNRLDNIWAEHQQVGISIEGYGTGGGAYYPVETLICGGNIHSISPGAVAIQVGTVGKVDLTTIQTVCRSDNNPIVIGAYATNTLIVGGRKGDITDNGANTALV